MRQIILVGMLSLLSSFQAGAQDKGFAVMPNIGVTSPILTEGVGIHIGVNPSFRLATSFAIEGQVSFIHNPIKGAFLSGETGVDNTFNLLFGGRFYLTKKERKTEFYVNLLLGRASVKQKRDDGPNSEEYRLGGSAGVYAELNRLVLGASFDSPSNPVLKLGYTF